MPCPAAERIFILVYLVLLLSCRDCDSNASTLTPVVATRWGKIRGVTVTAGKNLRPVDMFLGVPYATPPVGPYRFNPTKAPLPWDGVKMCTALSAVCPQRLPDLSNDTLALERMPRGRLLYLKRLLPFLQNQSEDCLYLNIYAPSQGKRRFTIFHPIVNDLSSVVWRSRRPITAKLAATLSHATGINTGTLRSMKSLLSDAPSDQHPVPRSSQAAKQANPDLGNEDSTKFKQQPERKPEPKSRIKFLEQGQGANLANKLHQLIYSDRSG
nr:PREDICTED: neuroligin 4-like [Bemisia tabaci]